MTLFDIFYQHTEWWCNPDLGHDTQGKYGDVLKEMEDCALDYARSIKDTGDRWKRVIENETRELCRPNHYSWNLRGDKKEWHDTVVRDFLIRIRKAIEHCYGYNFTELPQSILPSYGIYCDEWPTNRKPQQKHTEAPQQASDCNDGELTGNSKGVQPQGAKKRVKDFKKDCILADDKEQFLKALHKQIDGEKSADMIIAKIKGAISNKRILKPSYQTLINEFPNVEKIVPRSTYYEKMKK